MTAKVLQHLMKIIPQLDKNHLDDLIVDNPISESEQGLNVVRFISLMGFNTDKVPGMIVNCYCVSGSKSITIGTAKVRIGMISIALWPAI